MTTCKNTTEFTPDPSSKGWAHCSICNRFMRLVDGKLYGHAKPSRVKKLVPRKASNDG